MYQTLEFQGPSLCLKRNSKTQLYQIQMLFFSIEFIVSLIKDLSEVLSVVPWFYAFS